MKLTTHCKMLNIYRSNISPFHSVLISYKSDSPKWERCTIVNICKSNRCSTSSFDFLSIAIRHIAIETQFLRRAILMAHISLLISYISDRMGWHVSDISSATLIQRKREKREEADDIEGGYISWYFTVWNCNFNIIN